MCEFQGTKHGYQTTAKRNQAKSPPASYIAHACTMTAGKLTDRELILGVFHLHGKTGCSGEKSNGTDFSTGNFSEKVENLQRYSSFTVFTEMIEKSCTICLVPLVPRFLARFLPPKLTTWPPGHLCVLDVGLARFTQMNS